jgi:hypothetical protein
VVVHLLLSTAAANGKLVQGIKAAYGCGKLVRIL